MTTRYTCIFFLKKFNFNIDDANINYLPNINSTCSFQVVNEPADVHFPVVEMATRSKLSCLSWNKYTKSHIASSDYEGIVTVWDVNTRQVVAIIYLKFS